MKVYLAGIVNTMIGERRGKYRQAIDMLDRGINFLDSYYYIMSGGDRAIEWVSQFINSAGCRSFLLDSGAFTYMSNPKKNVNVDQYLDGYIKYINTFNVERFFELDIDVRLGYKAVRELRAKLERETGRQCIPVWHKTRGIADFKEMCQEYEYASIGGIASGELSRAKLKHVLPHLIRYARREGCKIHGLGVGRPNGTVYDYDSIDSTSWNAGLRYGTILHRFNGREIVAIKPDTQMKGDRACITEYNLAEWMKFADYMEGATCITS